MNPTPITTALQVRKADLPTTRLVATPDAPLAVGEVRVRIDLFALTSNNITYAAFGEAMHYWQFFPVPAEADRAEWGCIPVWGFGDVVASRHADLPAGERLYGYWPMATHAVLQPARVAAGGFSDGAPHRAALHAVYNQYQRCAVDPFYTADSEALQALLRPLFLTAWLIDDFLADQAWFGSAAAAAAEGGRAVMLLSSASSKTAIATAAQLAKRSEIEVVGLTSPARREFCRSLGLYHRVLGYDELGELPAATPCIYVDFAGSSTLRRAIHTRFTRLAYSCAIGGTHVTDLGSAADLPGPRATLFFAPAQAKKRSTEWGAAGFGQRLVGAWQGFRQQVEAASPPWLVAEAHAGAQAVQAAYAHVLAGTGDARQGHVMTLNAAGSSVG